MDSGSEHVFDVAVIGLGSVGAGVVREAALRGLTVVALDRGDVAGGTSSNSSKLIHGGVRYLEQGEIGLVFESVSERRALRHMAPHLVKPLPFLFPIYPESPHRLGKIRLGLWVYDALALFRSPGLHRGFSRKSLAEIEPTLRSEGLRGAAMYYDCATDDARLTLESALVGVDLGAEVRTYHSVEQVREAGGIFEVETRCVHSGVTTTVCARTVVHATGPWTDRSLGVFMEGQASGDVATMRKRLRTTRGSHVVVSREKLPLNHAVLCFHPRDKRVMFALPWGEHSYLGTTDTDDGADPTEVRASGEDVAYLLEAANDYFPGAHLSSGDVISTWSGLRPLAAPAEIVGGAEPVEGQESAVSREHTVEIDPSGVVTVYGGKLTTFRLMAKQVVDEVLRVGAPRGVGLRGVGSRVRTSKRSRRMARDGLKLPGGAGWEDMGGRGGVCDRVLALGEGTLDERTAFHLVDTYGVSSQELAKRCAADPELAAPLVEGRPEVWAQVDWAVERELAQSVSDVMVRRTQLFYRAEDQGLGVVQAVAERMATVLDWDRDRVAREVRGYGSVVARSRAWKQDC